MHKHSMMGYCMKMTVAVDLVLVRFFFTYSFDPMFITSSVTKEISFLK